MRTGVSSLPALHRTSLSVRSRDAAAPPAGSGLRRHAPRTRRGLPRPRGGTSPSLPVTSTTDRKAMAVPETRKPTESALQAGQGDKARRTEAGAGTVLGHYAMAGRAVLRRFVIDGRAVLRRCVMDGRPGPGKMGERNRPSDRGVSERPLKPRSRRPSRLRLQ